jgi:hypothetical protein
MNNQPPTQRKQQHQQHQQHQRWPHLASGLVACGSSGSGVALRSLCFRTERRAQSRSGRRVAMPEGQRRRHRVVVVTTS